MHDAQAAAFDDDRRLARGARGRGGAGAERDARFHRVFLDAGDGGRKAHSGGQAFPARRPGAAGIAGARRQSRGHIQGRRRQRHVAGHLQGHSAGSVPRRAGRGRRRRARRLGRVQGRHRARQARRELHAEGGRGRAEEAGPLEGRLRRKAGSCATAGARHRRRRGRSGAERATDDRGSRTLRAGAGAGAGADPVDRADARRALARPRADECRALDRAGAIAVRRGVVRGAGDAARHLRFFGRQRVREFAFAEAADLQDHRRLGQSRRLDAAVGARSWRCSAGWSRRSATICRCRCAPMCWRCRPGSPARSICSS